MGSKTYKLWYRLIAAAIAAMGLTIAPSIAAAPCDAACEQGRAVVVQLVEAFEKDKTRYLSRAYSEADLRRDFIDPFFAALGWDVANSGARQLYRQDTVPEVRLWKRGSVHYADYAFRIDGRSVFYTEVEAASRDVDDPEHIAQAVGYAWSSSHADIAVLTDFEAFRVYDVRKFGSTESLDALEVMSFRFSYTELAERFPEIWGVFSKKAVADGALTDLLSSRHPGGLQETVNEAFLKDLDRFRLRLGQTIHDNNAGLPPEALNEATHHILNQIVFGRVLEDRDIEPTGRLREAIEGWRSRGRNDPLWSFLRAEFGRLERRYNGVIFAAHFSDSLDIPNDVLVEIIDALYPPTSPYAFSIIPIDVLGRAYESYLGKRLVVEDGVVSLAPKPEVRRAGGVFYTPSWVVDYILDQTLAPKLKGKTINEIAALRVADPACGAGAFSVQMATRILNAALAYYAMTPDAIGGVGSEFPDAYTLYDGTLKLSVAKKAELIEKSVFCVDVDPQSVEITRMWLYILMLEDEASPIVTHERRYKIPNRIWPPKIRDFKLPNLDGNVVNGNSLVGSDFSENAQDRARVNAFDWSEGETRLAQTVRAGGFDVITGNPPYLRYRDAAKFIPDEAEYFRQTYKSMGAGQGDMSYAFIEKGLSLLNKSGRLGYITSNGFMWNAAGEPLRGLLAQSRSVHEVIDLGVAKVFKDAGPATAIVILDRSPKRLFRYARLYQGDFDNNNLLSELPALQHQSFAQLELTEDVWAFPAKSDRQIFDAMQQHTMTVGDVADAFGGSKTGADAVFLVEPLTSKQGKAIIKPKNSETTRRIERSVLQGFLRGRDVRRYEPPTAETAVVFPYSHEGNILSEEDFKRLFPLAYEYLSENRDILDARRSNMPQGPWYQFSSLTNFDHASRPKLVVGSRVGKPQFTIDADGQWLFQGTGRFSGLIPTDENFTLEMLLGVLNSNAVHAFARTTRPELWYGISYSPAFVESIPIVPMTDDSRPLYGKIAAKVSKILEINSQETITPTQRRKAEKLESEIDNLVIDLYQIDP